MIIYLASCALWIRPSLAAFFKSYKQLRQPSCFISWVRRINPSDNQSEPKVGGTTQRYIPTSIGITNCLQVIPTDSVLFGLLFLKSVYVVKKESPGKSSDPWEESAASLCPQSRLLEHLPSFQATQAYQAHTDRVRPYIYFAFAFHQILTFFAWRN